MTTLIIGFAYLVLASSLGFEPSPRRPIQYPFAFGAFALFLAVGPPALAIVALAALMGLVLRWPRRRRRGIGQAGPGALVLVAATVSVGIAFACLAAHLFHVGYPLPIRGARALALYLVVQGGGYVVFVAAKELGAALADGLAGAARGLPPAARTRSTIPRRRGRGPSRSAGRSSSTACSGGSSSACGGSTSSSTSCGGSDGWRRSAR